MPKQQQDFFRSDRELRVRVCRAVLRLGQRMRDRVGQEERFDPSSGLNYAAYWAPGDRPIYLVACAIFHDLDVGTLMLASEAKSQIPMPSAVYEAIVHLHRAIAESREAVDAWLKDHEYGLPDLHLRRSRPFEEA